MSFHDSATVLLSRKTAPGTPSPPSAIDPQHTRATAIHHQVGFPPPPVPPLRFRGVDPHARGGSRRDIGADKDLAPSDIPPSRHHRGLNLHRGAALCIPVSPI